MVLLVVVILVVVPVRVDDLYVGDRSVSVAHRDVAQRRDVEVGRLIVDQLAVESPVLTDADVTEVEVLTVAAVRGTDAALKDEQVDVESWCHAYRVVHNDERSGVGLTQSHVYAAFVRFLHPAPFRHGWREHGSKLAHRSP